MSKKNKTKLNIKNILILFVLIILLVIFITILRNLFENKTLKYINNSKNTTSASAIGNEHLLFENYEGNVKPLNVEKSIQHFMNTLVPEYRNIQNIEEYYKSNKSEIKKLLGIKNKEEFTSLVNKIKQLEKEELILEKYSILESSVTNEENHTNAVLTLQYEDCEVLLIKISIPNKFNKHETPVLYSSELEKEYSAKRNENYIDKGIHPEDGTGRVIE